MKRQSISRSLRRRVRDAAQYRCGYCLRSEELTGERMTIEHIHPQSRGGPSSEDNLWLACRRCNEFKGVQTHAIDPATGKRTRFFNPRTQLWDEHFGWDESGALIRGLTPVGRVTVMALRLNNPEIVVARRLWVAAGWWPPEE
ncbi:HNH endonuclease [candidate division KSB1 bacterium]|nr:MAG: HNH endonuclease [candidate division KSB1 bacterium]MBC6949180.1 HNH endonuclease [candidate division KSB1 bacterium]MCE7940270.1 HNH endonuclease [Chlorobi bacterium CHB1]MDL1874276.1 HNH endonuclease [Cytophagia bacterium CHB2]